MVKGKLSDYLNIVCKTVATWEKIKQIRCVVIITQELGGIAFKVLLTSLK